VQTAERRDARRLAVAVLAAILVHAGLVFAIPFLAGLDTAPLPDYGPIVVTLEEPAAIEMPAPRPSPKPAPTEKPAAKPVPTAKPAATAAGQPATASTAAPATTRTPGTSAFRQTGATTGTSAGAASESIVTGPPPVTLPAVGSTTPGSGEQTSGEAVLLTGKPPAGSGGSLDTGKLDTSLARAGTTGGTGTAAASGGGTASSSAATSIEWENPDAAKGRALLSAPLPRLPDWVKDLGLDLEVRIAFSVTADGLVTSPKVVQGSGYPDIDDACLAALRQYRFSTAAGAKALKGSQTFRTKQR
jgi:TonB family protein